MHWITYIGFIFFGIAQITTGCFLNTICTEDRGTILQFDADVRTFERTRSRGRNWCIVNKHRRTFNAILAFKNFTSPPSAKIMVVVYTPSRERKVQFFEGKLGNFELLYRDTVRVVIHVPVNSNRKTPNFILNYYTGCQVLTAVHDQISFPQSSYIRNDNETVCWYIQPSNVSEHGMRTYFSIRDVNLNEDQRLAVWDVHTSQVIATAGDGEEFQMVAAQSDQHQSVLVDLLCTNKHCSRDFNSFFLTYYALSQEDVTCIERQQACADRDDMLLEECDITCPALDNILTEEYYSQIYLPMARNGLLEDEDILGVDVQMEDGRSEKNKPTTNRQQYRRRCPLPSLPPKLCSCPKTVRKEIFCHSRIQCFQMGPCTFACIFHKVTTCLRLRVISSLKLL